MPEQSRDVFDRKKIENRKLLDSAELFIFHLPFPGKAKLLCLYLLRTCDWLTFNRDEGRAVLSRILGCSEDQVSRYTRAFDEVGIVRIVRRGSNLSGMVHTYQLNLDHKFWNGDEQEVSKLAAKLTKSIRKGRTVDPLIELLMDDDQNACSKAAESVEQTSRQRPMPLTAC